MRSRTQSSTRSGTPDLRFRARLTELMDEPCGRDEMRACLRDLAWTNRWTLAYWPVLRWLESLRGAREAGPLRILDVGCGYGDTLRRIERWASKRGVAVELTGLDLNPDSVAIAKEASPAESKIRWVAGDLFDYLPPEPVDAVVCSLFTHHLDEEEIVRFMRWMERQTRVGWFISDLSRAAIPYHFFRIFSKVAGLHRFVQHDGPVSIARSFVRADWERMCAAAGFLAGEVNILSYKPARLCVSRVKAGLARAGD